MPRDSVTPESEPNLTVAALASQLERLTAIVMELESQVDANERLSADPHGQSLGLSPKPPQSPGYIQPSPYYQQPLIVVMPPQSLPAAASSSMKKVTSAPNPDRFHLQSLECAFKLDNYFPKLNSTALGSVENTFEEHVTDLEKDGEGFSSCGEINTLHEISTCVIHELDDCSSSPFGKRIMTEEFHKFDDKIINDKVNSDDGDDASFNLFCDSALVADARLIPPRTDTLSPQLCVSSFCFDMSMDYPKEYWDVVDSRCLSRPYPSRGSQPAAPVVPPPPPQRSHSCRSSTRPTSHCLPLPAAAAALCNPDIVGDDNELLDDDWPPPTMMTLSCSPNIRYDSMELIVDDDSDESVKSCSSNAIDRLHNRDQVGIEEVLLDHEETNGFPISSSRGMTIQELCFRARREALECIPVGPDVCGTFYCYGVKAIVIYCPRRPRMHVILGIHTNAKMCRRRAWKPYASANFSYLSLFESTSLKGWDLDVMLSVIIPWILVTHDDLLVSLSFIGGLSRTFSTNRWQIPSVTFWIASALVGTLFGKSWFTYATSIEKCIDESFVVHSGLLVVMVKCVLTKVDEELLQSFLAIAFGAFCVVVRSTIHAHVAANFLYECDLSQQISNVQAPISGFLLHIHRNYASVNFCNMFHEVAAAGANLEYNGLEGETGYRVHDPGLAMAAYTNAILAHFVKSVERDVLAKLRDERIIDVRHASWFPP